MYQSGLLPTTLDWGFVSLEKSRYLYTKCDVFTDQLDEYFARTKELIEETYAINGERKVYLICHSLGCLRSIHFLNLQSQEWKDHYIKEYITLSAPWAGSAQSLLALIEGNRKSNWSSLI